jgi:hypothetical protein
LDHLKALRFSATNLQRELQDNFTLRIPVPACLSVPPCAGQDDEVQSDGVAVNLKNGLESDYYFAEQGRRTRRGACVED